jgi:hypothetical protein
MHVGSRFVWCMGAILLLGSYLYAGEHPFPVTENSNCLECHTDRAVGNHAHPAVKSGCVSCHKIEDRQDAT